ncbi:MAG: YdeI/OmpD-associated family protein [Candidatus Pacearchaeota archaeon]
MKNISSGTIHKMPSDLKKVLLEHQEALDQWESLTPLARNEFICWIEDAKKNETRIERIGRTLNDLINGKRRPCCWIGCIHRTDKAISPSIKGILARRTKKK